MNVQQFEQEILRLAFETDTRITAASVAYYLGIPSREANRMLNELLQQGVLELDSDVDGNLFYRVPNQGAVKGGSPQVMSEEPDEDELEKIILGDLFDQAEPAPEVSARPEASGPPPMPEQRSPSKPKHALDAIGLVSADNDDESKPFSPSRNRPPEVDAMRAADGSSAGRPASEDKEDARRPRPTPQPTTYRPVPDDGDGHTGSTGHAATASATRSSGSYADVFDAVKRVERDGGGGRSVFRGLTSRSMEPDAWVGNCGASAVVVAPEARCEPKPLSDARPTLVSCIDPQEEEEIRRSHLEHAQRQGQREWWEHTTGQHNDSSTAMVLASNQNLPATLDDIEQPEHQPGMALLLSLILCGTGQIYNGEVSKGIMMMVLCFLLWFVLLGWVVHIWSIVDAVVVAERINRRQHA